MNSLKPIIYGLAYACIAWLAIQWQTTEYMIIFLAFVIGIVMGNHEELKQHYGKILNKHSEKLFPSKWDHE